MLKKSKTELDYLRFHKKLINILEKKGGDVNLNVVASELGLQKFDLLEKLCSYSKSGTFELDGDNLVLPQNRNLSLELDLVLHDKMFESIENEISENVSQELLDQIREKFIGPTDAENNTNEINSLIHTQINENIMMPLENSIKSQFNKGEDNRRSLDLKDWDLAAFKERINEIKRFTRRIRLELLNNYFRSKYNNLPNILDLLNQEFKDLFRKEGEFIIFNF